MGCLYAAPVSACRGPVGLGEQDVIARLRRLIDGGAIARFGLVVRHQVLGYRANAMVVWDIDEGVVSEIGPVSRRRPA